MRHRHPVSVLVHSLAAFALVGSGLAYSQSPVDRAGRPVPIANPHLAANGHAETWDGRLFVLTRNGPQGSGWYVRALRPESLASDPSGLPRFEAAAFSPLAVLEIDRDPDSEGIAFHNALALVPAPGWSPNPFRSDASGTPAWDGPFETYELVVFSQSYGEAGRLGLRRARIVVENPRTARATVTSARFLSRFQELRSGSSPLVGIEPTVTFDGRLLVWQMDGTLRYSHNRTPATAEGWSAPRSIADMYHVDRTTDVDGIPFRERFPIAEAPLRDASGQVYGPGEAIRGAYPWIDHDGSLLVYAATIAGTAGVNRARRGGLSVVGRWTGHVARHVDGPLNPDRETTVRLFFSSPGAVPGFWRPWPDAPSHPLPYTGGQPVVPLFGSNTANYGEISFEDHEDKGYALYLRMNELVTKQGTIATDRTPDTSGNVLSGTLEGAAFPREYDGTDGNVGVSGQSIYFPDRGLVRVPRAAVLDLRRSLSVEVWVKRLVDLDQGSGNRSRYLLNRPDSWNLMVGRDGRVRASIIARDGSVRTLGPIGPAIALGEWTHVAFTYSSHSGRLTLYVAGRRVAQRDFGPGEIATSNADLLVGPGGQHPPAPFVPADQAILLLDEVKVSRVVRFPSEIGASAFLNASTPTFPGRLLDPLPLGLEERDLRVPAGTVTNSQVLLGKRLFFEPRLSSNGAVSCATCHDPTKAFTDGRPRARGVTGRDLIRNTPTLANRAFSTRQTWDGRAISLEAQSMLPIEHPDEMGMSVERALAWIRGSPRYTSLFQAAYGADADEARLRSSFAAFVRSLVSGDSRVDRFQAGDRSALTPGEERGRTLFHGKARCVACHTGSNYSDEEFHNTGFLSNLALDPGRSARTGRARDRGRFKTPTLRDVDLTAPYLHDGSLPTLEQVIDRYDRGGISEENRDAEIRPLGLTPAEKADLAAFLRALTGRTLDTTPP